MLRERRRHANYKPNRRLDRKSSRGMIYENEELRLRTININAEVERGQSDIRKLRRENEQLKREIWSLRDEYDRINKKICANKNCSSCEHISNSGSQSEDSDYCDTCKENDPVESCTSYKDEQIQNREDKHIGLLHSEQVDTGDSTLSGSDYNNSKEIVENYENAQKTLVHPKATSPPESSSPSFLSPSSTVTNKHSCKVPPPMDNLSSKLRENLHVNFGQLSVLSEENLTNSDGASSLNGELGVNVSTTLHETPVSPMREIQSILPPLSHFENIPYDSNISLSAKKPVGDSSITTIVDDRIVSSVNIPKPNFDNSEETKQISTQFRSPKHFFSPINPRRTKPFANPPDLFVANALASPSHYHGGLTNQLVESSTSQHLTARVPVAPYSSDSSFYDGNLEDLLLEIETLQIQLEKHKSFSQEKLPTNETFSTRKPYRSEMNLVVSCNGCKPRITPIVNHNSSSLSTECEYKSELLPTNSLVLETPPPNIPQPMILFPQNLTYVARETNVHCSSLAALTETPQYCSQFPSTLPSDRLQNTMMPTNVTLPTCEDKDTIKLYEEGLEGIPSSSENQRPTLNTDVAPNIAKISSKIASVSGHENSLEMSSSTASTIEIAKSPVNIRKKDSGNQLENNKSPYSDDKFFDSVRSASNATDNLKNDSSSSSETGKRKATRRISISFSDVKKRDLDKNERQSDQNVEDKILNNKAMAVQTGDCTINGSQKSHKPPFDLITQSTPNSPHFNGRRTSGAHAHHHHHQHSAHHCSRKLSQDSIKTPRKCSRRFSDGTVDTLPHGSCGSAYGGSFTCGDNRRHGNSHEPGTSVSERNSNSFASSRESSTSQSTHSQRRKLSVTSHNGGKIPWCGCWGNGCL